MKISLRYLILINLLFGELLATILGISTILFLEHQDIQASIDHNLVKSVFTVSSFIDKPFALQKLHTFESTLENATDVLHTALYKYKQDYFFDPDLFNFYIWSPDGHLLFGNNNLMGKYFSLVPLGFSYIKYKNESWRTFSTINPKTQIKIMAAERTDLHEISTRNLAREFIIIIFTGYFFIGFFMWLVLARSLHMFKKISTEVREQGPDHLSTLDASKLPVEIRPIIEEWNKLSDRLKVAFNREKRFAADAAHELKTPLAALKTHTQLALHAKNENELVNALHKIVSGVNRSTHVVNQLLILNRMSQTGMLDIPLTAVDVVQQAKEIIADLVPQAFEKNTEIELIAGDTPAMTEGHETAISILIRNLVDNAIRYSPENSLIQVVVDETPDKKNIILKIIDNGPGIPENLRQRVFERFFRVIGNKSPGSGLGLGIVQQIAELHGAHISLDTPPSGNGLQVTVMFPQKNSSDLEKN